MRRKLTNVTCRFGDLREPVKRIIGDELGKKLTRMWGLDAEGEVNGVGKELGLPGLWYLSGTNCLIVADKAFLLIYCFKVASGLLEFTPSTSRYVCPLLLPFL